MFSSAIYSNILSAVAHRENCRHPVCMARSYLHKIFEKKSLETLLNEVFLYYNVDWDLNPHTEKLFDLAVCHFLKRMQPAGRNRQEAENFVEYTIKSLCKDDGLEDIINVDLLREWETLIV